MKCQTKILTAISIIAMLMTCIAIADVSDDSSADSSQKIYFSVNETLHFGDQLSVYSSVSKINQAAGTAVCEYSNDCLRFTKSIDMKMDVSDSANGVLIFDNNAGTQYISVDEGIDVTIRYEGNTAADAAGTIIKKGEGDLALNGKGDLIVITSVPKSFAVISSNDIYFEGNSYVNSTSADCKGAVSCSSLYCSEDVHIESQSDGVVMSGKNIRFDDCNVKIHCTNYGIRCSELQKISVNKCDADIIGSKYSAISKNPSSIETKLTDVYASNDVSSNDGRSSIGLGDVAYYKHVMMEHKETADYAPLATIVIIAIAIIIAFMIVVILVIRSGKKSSNKRLLDHHDHNEYVTNDEDTSDGSAGTEIMTQSFVQGLSFILAVDGQMVGFIDTHKSYVRIEPGTHKIIVMTDDYHRKIVYEKSHVIREDTRIIVEKKLNSYRIRII